MDADDAQPPDEAELEVEKRIRELNLKPSSTALRAVKSSLGSSLNANRLKHRIERTNHSAFLEELKSELDYSVLQGTRENGKEKNQTAVQLVNIEENFSTIKRKSPEAAGYFDFITTQAVQKIFADGKLLREDLILPYSAFLQENGGPCSSADALCKGIERYGPILRGLYLMGEYEPTNPKEDKKVLSEHDIVGPIRRITNRDGYVRILFEPEFNFGVFFKFRYPFPPYFWKLTLGTRSFLDRLLETTRMAGGEHGTRRASALHKDHIFTSTINSAIMYTNIPDPTETKHRRRDIIENVEKYINEIKYVEARQRKQEAIRNLKPDENGEYNKAELAAEMKKHRYLDVDFYNVTPDERDINKFLDGKVIVKYYGQFADDMLAQSKKQTKKIQKEERKAEKRKENVEYRLARNAAKSK